MASGRKAIKQAETENKKQNNQIMKTRNNNTETKKSKMKVAILKGGAIIISFVLISFTVSAQGFWKQLLTESSLSNVAMIMVGNTSTNSKATINNPSTIENATGEKTYFNSFEMESDKPLDLEAWMTSDSFFKNFNYKMSQDVDPNLEIEDWMINSKYFRNVSSTIRTEKDKELKLENWMINDKLWRM